VFSLLNVYSLSRNDSADKFKRKLRVRNRFMMTAAVVLIVVAQKAILGIDWSLAGDDV